MKTLELFCGTKSFSKVAAKLGHETFTVDFDKQHDPDLCIDILELTEDMIPFKPDVIWCSPPCTTFSVASIGYHWNHGGPSPEAKKAIQIISKMLELIIVLRPRFWFIENPRGMLRVLPFFDMMHHKTVSYCQYGDKRMKPTDIWTNFKFWMPKAICTQGDKCHESATRGSRTGTQGIKGAVDRGAIPEGLFQEIFQYMGVAGDED